MLVRAELETEEADVADGGGVGGGGQERKQTLGSAWIPLVVGEAAPGWPWWVQ